MAICPRPVNRLGKEVCLLRVESVIKGYQKAKIVSMG
jgi:hypothetical protein